jgi:hypothetical protein
VGGVGGNGNVPEEGLQRPLLLGGQPHTLQGYGGGAGKQKPGGEAWGRCMCVCVCVGRGGGGACRGKGQWNAHKVYPINGLGFRQARGQLPSTMHYARMSGSPNHTSHTGTH